MAYASAIGSPSVIFSGRRAFSSDAHPISGFSLAPKQASKGRKFYKAVVAKAAGNGSDSSSGSIVKIVQNAWGSSDDRLAIFGTGFASIAAVWATSNLYNFVDNLPVVPNVLQLIGILFSWWFIYRYLLFKPDREELSKSFTDFLSDVLNR